jgi:hypothetical protein
MAMGLAPKCHFVLGLPTGSPEIPKVRTPATLEAHNFVVRPSIEMRFEEIFLALIKSFPTVCHTPPARKEIGAILNF